MVILMCFLYKEKTMEYYRDPKNQIYADLAYRLGKIVSQYEKMNVDEEKFEASLYLAILQNLMTNSNEYVREMTRSIRKSSIFNKNISDSIWGIDESCWVKNTFNEEHNLQNFITRIRNSVSHPTHIDIKSEFPSTGFSTIKGDSGIIEKFRFINSPDTNRNRAKQMSLKEIQNTIYDKGRAAERKTYCEFPDNISYRLFEGGKDEKYEIVLDGKLFVRISIIDLTVNQLSIFVKELANYLAQPIEENWDGITIKNLIAV